MTKRFTLRLSKLGNGMITDTQKKEDLYFDKEFLDATLLKTTNWLNKLHDENEQLNQQAQKIKEILISLNKNKGFWDSALLQGVIESISKTIGVDIE